MRYTDPRLACRDIAKCACCETVRKLASTDVVRSCRRSGIPQLVVQLFGLWLLAAIAQWFSARLPIPVPPGAVGMTMLFALLCSGVVSLDAIERGAMLLVRHLGLFLIPYAVSVMAFADLLASSGLALAVALVGSTAIGMGATGWTAQATSHAAVDRGGPVERGES